MNLFNHVVFFRFGFDSSFSYYGYYLWNILNHICLPLTMFYRFHSSVCLVEIWNNAFIPVKKHK